MSETTELRLPETLHIESEPPPEAQEEGERQLTPREIAMAAIAKKAEEQRGKEIAQGAIYDAEARERGEALPEPEADEPVEQEAVAASPVAPEQPQAAPPPPPPAPVTPQLRMLNLNGQQIAVTDEQFAQLAQMGALAGMHLAAQQAQPQPTAPVPPPHKPAVIVDDAKVLETVQRIQYGSPAEGTAALSSLIQDVVAQVPQAPAIDQNALIQQAEHRAVAAIEAQRVLAIIRSEYPEIFKDQDLMMLAQSRSHRLHQNALATGQRMNELDVYREAGGQVYDLLKLPRPGSEVQPTAPQAAPTVRPRAGVEERKRAAPRNTQPVDRRSAPPEAAKAPTGAEIVDWMRQSRNQARMN